MNITIEAWHMAVISTAACWWRAYRMEDGGYLDFVTPFLMLALIVGPVLAWGMYFLGAWLQ